MADGRVEELKSLLPRCQLQDWVRLGSRLARLLRDPYHAATHDALLTRLLHQAHESCALREHRQAHRPAVAYPPDLPITARKDEIVAAIRQHQVLVIAGETGSGKTTQIPKMCLEAGLGIEAKIGCTQPRRVAALSISQRLAEELNVEWGREVGCKIRFDDRSSPETYIKLMTDGILLAEVQGDPLLTDYNAIIIDEAHERSLNIDFLLGHLRGLLARRKDLKLIITSATIDTESFSRAFDNAPILEVSGRLYPVEEIYAPLDAASEEEGDLTVIDAAVAAVHRILDESHDGDILIFMPGERDIRETRDLLDCSYQTEIIPLFGRLSAGEQQRVFAPSSRRKIVIATNIAETSLTIPGIRYVIDSGLARISRYNPRTRTKRLPVEPISQSSANQRKGRSGRVQNGICIRLYSEEDFQGRPLHTMPEIQRANLAEVILRMKAFHLGEIETFPFINPPQPAAIQAGYRLLHELGALDEQRALTDLGRDLARLPIDPTLGRMLLQSEREHATRELLIIAAGLSIQDPRERPMDQRDAAAAAHKRFVDPQSDFLTLLNIWHAFHEEWEKLKTQNQRRKFCKAHFLSYLRMREWQELHAQLQDALEGIRTVHLNESNAAYAGIHRSILAGLLAHVACRTERNIYNGTGNRPLMVFPGSAIFDRFEKPVKKPAPAARGAERNAPAPRQPAWIVAGEIVETSQVFARTLAGIDPEWIFTLAPHLCEITHHHPHWSARAGSVLVEERTALYGLEVRRRQVAYGNIAPREATELFIRAALIEDEITDDEDESRGDGVRARPLIRSGPATSLTDRYPFLKANAQVRHKIETWQTRVRHHALPDLDEALFQFYLRAMENVSSLHDLNRLLREHPEKGFLHITEAELVGAQELNYDAASFPDAVTLAGQPVALQYAYAPGEDRDGVTVQLPLELARTVSAASVAWSIPGLREEQVSELLRALPKSIRRELMPFPPKVAEIVREFRPEGESLLQDLARFLQQRYGVAVAASAWPAGALPPHLQPRVEVVGPGQKSIATGRDLEQLRQTLKQTPRSEPADLSPAWAQATARWERFGLAGWTFEDLPEKILITESEGLPVYAWPGLALEEEAVNLRLLATQQAAQTSSLVGVQKLLELALQRDFGWLQKDLRSLSRLEPLHREWLSSDELQDAAFQHLKRHLLPQAPLPALAASHYEAALQRARTGLPGLATEFAGKLEAILQLRQEIVRRSSKGAAPAAAPRQKLTDFKQLAAAPASAPSPSPGPKELVSLLPKEFLTTIPYGQMKEVPRYLKALLLRLERATLNPPKEQERARTLAPYEDGYRKARDARPKSAEARARLEEFRWMLEEFKVSLFAQELGTAFPISPKRLDQQWARVQECLG